MAQPDSAIATGKEIIRLSKQAGIQAGVIKGYNMAGMAYWAKGDFNSGLQNMQQAMKIAQQHADTPELATVYGNIAILYIDMGDKDMGLEYSKKAISLFNATGQKKNAIHYINNIGWIYESKEMYDSALYYYKIAVEGYETHFDTQNWLGQAYANLSSTYGHAGEPGQAMAYGSKAVNTSRKYPDNKKALGHSYLALAKAHLDNGTYRQCILYADSALQLAADNNINTLIAEAHWLKYKAYEQTGNYKAAIQHLELNRKWTDSLVNEETDAQLARVKTALATEKKDKEIALNKAARQQTMFYLILSLITIVFVSVTAYQLYKRQQMRIKTRDKQLELEQKDKKLVELDLQNQQLKNEELNKELLTFTLTTAQKNQLLQDINEQLNNLPDTNTAELRKVKHIVQTAMGSEEEWEEFKLRFEQVHRSFFEELKNDFPTLTPNDLRMCAFIKLNLNSKQVASLLNIAPSSADISKYRLKKKLGLEKEDNITDLINKY